MGLRPEHLRVRRANGHADGRISRVEHLGDQNHLHIDLDGASLVTLVEPAEALGPGDCVSVTFADPLLFDAAGRRVRG